MTREDIDIMWQQALQDSVRDGEMFTRYHFAKLVAAKERDACVAVCERHAKVYSDLPKTLVTDLSWAACIDIRDSIKRRGEA